MRIATNFGERTTIPREIKKKFILVFEGDKTEYQYFSGVNQYKNEIGINALVEIKALMRSARFKNVSNPVKIIEQLIEYLKENERQEITYGELVEKICDYLCCEAEITDDSVLNANFLYKDLIDFLALKGLDSETLIDDIDEILEAFEIHLCSKFNVEKTADQIKEYMNNSNEVFDKDFDKICIVIDRDRKSFKSQQYDYVLEQCQENGFNLYVSNPCFEFWLLLHTPEVKSIDQSRLYKNRKERPKSKKNFIENLLSERLGGYNKNALNFEKLKDGINLAINQEKLFCEDIKELKSKLGTNIGLLIIEMKNV